MARLGKQSQSGLTSQLNGTDAMSETSLISLDFEGKQVRMVGSADHPEWVAADVCRVLGIRNTSQAVAALDADEKGICQIYSPGGTQKSLVVNEFGLYALVQRSDKPEAKEFRRFVNHSVLPSLRAHGCYPPPEVATDSTALVAVDPQALMVQMGETFRNAVFSATEPRFQKLDDDMEEVKGRLSDIERRQDLTSVTKKRHCAILVRYYAGRCPCCKDEQIIADGGTRLDTLQFDHWVRPSMNGAKETWPVCEKCNMKLRDRDWKKARAPYFEAYQADRQRFEDILDGPRLFREQDYE